MYPKLVFFLLSINFCMGMSCFGLDDGDWGLGELSLEEASVQSPVTLVPLYDQSTVELLIEQRSSRDILDKKDHNSPALDLGNIVLSPVIYLPLEMAFEETTEHNTLDKTTISNPLTFSLPSLQEDSEDVGKGEITPSSVACIPGDYERRKRFKCVITNKKNLGKEDVVPTDKMRRKRSRVISSENDLSELNEEDDKHTLKTIKSQAQQECERAVLVNFTNYVF